METDPTITAKVIEMISIRNKDSDNSINFLFICIILLINRNRYEAIKKSISCIVCIEIP